MSRKSYFLMVNPVKGDKLREALKAELESAYGDTAEKIKRVLAELEGIHEMERGFSRQLVLSKPEIRLVKDLNSKYKLEIEIPSL